MSFLAPLFLLGAAAIALPILFHLIRRTSREKVPFSSLMFLEPTPPRVTRRSRLENILLLLLRCAVLCLLAFAFARPFLRQPAAALPERASKRIVVLVDRSASMRRDDLWNEARARAEAIARQAGPGDELVLATFDRQAQVLVGFQEWTAAAAGERPLLVQRSLAAADPGWGATHLGNALLRGAELVEETGSGTVKPGEIILISDLQAGARLEGLQGFDWPRNTIVRLESVRPRRKTNAGLQILSTTGGAEDRVLVRIHNAADSAAEQFQVRWAGSETSAVPVYVPPGQTRTVTLPAPATDSDRAMLLGDEHDFDNTAFFARANPERINVLYVGAAAEGDPQQMLFYLQRAFPTNAQQMIAVLSHPPNAPPGTNAAMIVLDGVLPEPTLQWIRQRIEQGAVAVVAMANPESAATISALTEIPVTAEEARASGYAMFGEIDFTHPLFASFADARFSDFTKIHFWKHRRVQFAPDSPARIVARFDNGDPAVAQINLGSGTVFVLASGWHPADSQLALSSKFVPLLFSMLEIGGAIRQQTSLATVGDSVEVAGGSSSAGTGSTTIRKVNDQLRTLSAGERAFKETEVPGIYGVSNAAGSFALAINLAPEESRTAPLDRAELERLGVPLQAVVTLSAERLAKTEAQLQAAELESRQKLWRWLIAGTLVILMVETWMAARLSRRHGVQVEGAA